MYGGFISVISSIKKASQTTLKCSNFLIQFLFFLYEKAYSPKHKEPCKRHKYVTQQKCYATAKGYFLRFPKALHSTFQFGK